MSAETTIAALQEQLAQLTLQLQQLQASKQTHIADEEAKHSQSILDDTMRRFTLTPFESSDESKALNRLKLINSCELKVTDSLRLKSELPADILIYKNRVEDYLRSNSVLFLIDDKVSSVNNPFT
jgi:hypothetical protein